MNKREGIASKISIVHELFVFLGERKLWWMIPLFFVMLTFGLILVAAQGSPLAPFIYTLF